jgi:RNA polymerase-binding transcription factor DksA
MPGYDGNPDAAAEAAQDHVDSLVHAASSMLQGPVLTHCKDCGEEIDPRRVEAARVGGRTCQYCIDCQEDHDRAPRVRMLDHIL